MKYDCYNYKKIIKLLTQTFLNFTYFETLITLDKLP